MRKSQLELAMVNAVFSFQFSAAPPQRRCHVSGAAVAS
jgi:hypothetical protein